MTPARVLVLAADAMDKDLVLEWAAAGRLPTFRRLFAEGTSGVIANPIGLYVGAAWASFLTGARPEHHGRYCHSQLEPGTYDIRPFRAADLRVEPFWNQLSRAGRRVAVIDVPKAPLATGLNGIHLVDWGTHDPEPGAAFATWPPDLATEISARFGKDLADLCDRRKEGEAALRSLRDSLLLRVRTKGELVSYLLDRGGWDLFLAVFNDPQCVGHHFWHLHDSAHPRYEPALARSLGDPIADVYAAIDAAMGKVLHAVGRETIVIVIGSHGMGPHYGGSFLLDEILRRLETSYMPLAAVRRTIGAAVRWCWAHTPFRLSRLPGPVAQRLRTSLREAVPLLAADDDRKCFQIPNNDVYGAIRINVFGREPRGCVRRGAEYDALCEQLMRDLRELVDARTGRPVVRDVVRTADYYPRRDDDDLPDLMVEWADDHPFDSVSSARTGTIEGEYRGKRTGDHRRGGFFVVSGRSVGPGRIPEAVPIESFAPTIASLLGVRLQGVDGGIIGAISGHER